MFYSPRTADAIFFDSLNQNIEKALDITNNIIILEDMNEDLLNPNMHNLKNVLLLNSLHNIISEPTRQLALLDPIIFHEDMSTLSQGIIQVPNEKVTTVLLMYIYHLNTHYMILLPEMYGYIEMQIMNCSIKNI